MKSLICLTVLVVACLSLAGCAQAIVKVKPDEIEIKINTFAKDIVWGDYKGTSHPFSVFWPPLFVETEKPVGD